MRGVIVEARQGFADDVQGAQVRYERIPQNCRFSRKHAKIYKTIDTNLLSYIAMKHCWLIILTLILQTPIASGEEAVYRGLLDGSIGLTIGIDSQKNPSVGTLHYDSSGSDGLQLQGTALAGGRFEWKESLEIRGGDTIKHTGTFKGQWKADGTTALGTWQSADGKKLRTLTLTRLARIQKVADKTVDASVSYPQFDDPHYAQLNQLLAAQAAKKLVEHVVSVQEARKELQEAAKESKDEEQLKYSIEVPVGASTECSVDIAQTRFVSLLCQYFIFTGGAHPNSRWSSLNYLLNVDGGPQEIGLWDLINKSPAALSTLSGWLVAELKRQQASLVVDGEINNFRDDLEKNNLPFTIIPAGLAFHFSPYSVASYAEGEFDVVVPKKTLKDVIRSDNPWIH